MSVIPFMSDNPISSIHIDTCASSSLLALQEEFALESSVLLCWVFFPITHHYFWYGYLKATSEVKTYVWSSSLQPVSRHSVAIHRINWSCSDLSFLWSSSAAAHADFPLSFQSAADSCGPASAGAQKGPSSWQEKPHIYCEDSWSQYGFITGTVSESQLLQALLALQQRAWETPESQSILEPKGWHLKVVGFKP